MIPSNATRDSRKFGDIHGSRVSVPRLKALGLGAVALGIFLLLPGWASAADQPRKSALELHPAGWKDIMPPSDLKGWFDVPIPATAKLIRPQWHVEKEMLTCDGDGGHDVLLYDHELRNCIFHVEFCFPKIEGKTGYNSGVFIRTSRDGAIWHQAQVMSLGGGYLFGVTPVAGGGTKSFNAQTQPIRVKEAGQWNTFEVTARGSHLTLWVNGFVTAEFPDCGLKKGYVGLEGEGFLIHFRNLKLKRLAD